MLEFFPYPSGEGLSVGHVRNYVIGDVVARYKRMRGFDVLHPMGWDAFGLPAENEARKHGRHPAVTTRQYAANYRRQMDLVGVGYDWSREIFSSDPDYYRWTQWLFLLLHERGLAYRGTSRQWWCSECETVLANEQVAQSPAGPECWRGHRAVARREVSQWFLRITDYADRLLADLAGLDWPEGIVAMQRHWIGRSEGVEIDFAVDAAATSREPIRAPASRPDMAATSPELIRVFTTRPDTLYGVTALVLAPEHPAVAALTRPGRRDAVAEYVENAGRRSEMERRADDKPKTGVFTGAHARHPLTGERLPVWVADYVLPDYGGGAVMLVPAHDERDSAFAAVTGLPSLRVVASDDAAATEPGSLVATEPDTLVATGPGTLIASGPFSGMGGEAGGRAITEALTEGGAGRQATTYRMRDWSIGRQRFWGAPIPIVHCPDCGAVPVPESDLPVRLPDVETVPGPGVDEAGAPVSPLAAIPGFVETACPVCGGDARRETDTMDGFACSSWYFLRFASPDCADGPFDRDAVERWLPVDLYVGGAEHAVMHLLYARFWTKVLYDAGLIGFDEPFPMLRNQGMILDATGAKMAKSRPEHLVTPDAAVAAHGADALRAYELFIAPYDQDVAWNEGGVAGVSRWLRRVWLVAQRDLRADVAASAGHESGDAAERAEGVQRRTPAADLANESAARHLHRVTHTAIRDVTGALESFRFNVAVAHMMTFTNELAEAAAHRGAAATRVVAEPGGPAATPDAAESEGLAVARDAVAGTAMPDAVAGATAWTEAVDALLRMLAPIAPHIAEELWERRGNPYSIHQQAWPEFDAALIARDNFELVVQVGGRVRDRVVVPVGVTEREAVAAALGSSAVERALGGAEPSRIIFVPGRLVNIVI